MFGKTSCLLFLVLAMLIVAAQAGWPIKSIKSKFDVNHKPMKVIIDTDAGSDDAFAILLALAAKDKVQVVGITCTYGNTYESNVETNVLKTLTIAKRTDIPVYAGVQRPLVRNFTVDDNYFGKDGFGDFDFGRPVEGAIDTSMNTTDAMIEITKKYPGEISIVTLGPLTNVAVAASRDPNFTRNVKRFYVMGSRVNETGPIYWKKEFNFGLDPESNDIFLKSPTRRKIVILPGDINERINVTKDWRMNVLGKMNSEKIEFLNKAESVVLKRNMTKWESIDAISVATMIWPEMVTRRLEAHMTAITSNDVPLGAVIVDFKSQSKNVDIIRDINQTDFQNKLVRYLVCN